jgi:hypothetical protein
MSSDIIQVRFEIRVPDGKWLAILNKEYNYLTFNIISNLVIDENLGNTLIEIKGLPLKTFIEEFKNTVPSSSFQFLHQEDNFLLLNVKTKDPWILNALVKTELLFLYPLQIIDGVIKVTAIAERKKVDKFLVELEQKEIEFKIIRIGEYQQERLLSGRQTKLLKMLYQNGYYEVPRRISLTKLAKKLDVSPSALSESIRRVHKKLARNQFL